MYATGKQNSYPEYIHKSHKKNLLLRPLFAKLTGARFSLLVFSFEFYETFQNSFLGPTHPGFLEVKNSIKFIIQKLQLKRH